MHSWVFRHRARLRVIYGVAAGPAAAPATRSAPRPARRLKPGHGGARGTRAAPGTIQRGGRGVTLLPMRRRAG